MKIKWHDSSGKGVANWREARAKGSKPMTTTAHPRQEGVTIADHELKAADAAERFQRSELDRQREFCN